MTGFTVNICGLLDPTWIDIGRARLACPAFWLINQNALHNHAFSVVHHRHWCHLCTPPSGTALDIET